MNYEEDGSGSGGYAKEMSDGYKQAEAQLMLDQVNSPSRDPCLTLTSDLGIFPSKAM